MNKLMIIWFASSYIEEESEILKILDNACVENACSIESLYEACLMMKQLNNKKTSLYSEIKYFAKLSNYGISGYEAGKKLRNYFIKVAIT